MAPHRIHLPTTAKQHVDPLGKALRPNRAAKPTADLNNVGEIPQKTPLRPPTPARRRAHPSPPPKGMHTSELPIILAEKINRINTRITWGNLPSRGDVLKSCNQLSSAASNEMNGHSVASQVPGNSHTRPVGFSNPHGIVNGLNAMGSNEHFFRNGTGYLMSDPGNLNDVAGREMWVDTGNGCLRTAGMETDGMDLD